MCRICAAGGDPLPLSFPNSRIRINEQDERSAYKFCVIMHRALMSFRPILRALSISQAFDDPRVEEAAFCFTDMFACVQQTLEVYGKSLSYANMTDVEDSLPPTPSSCAAERSSTTGYQW